MLFGPDPFAQQPGWAPPAEDAEPSDLPRPKWPVITTILIIVVVMVGAMGIWVF